MEGTLTVGKARRGKSSFLGAMDNKLCTTQVHTGRVGKPGNYKKPFFHQQSM